MNMPDYAYAIIGIAIIFLCTTLGFLLVFFFRKKEISNKLNRIFIGFAAGCMIYVVVEEMVPEMKGEGHDHFGVWSFIFGFVIMMVLDCIQF